MKTGIGLWGNNGHQIQATLKGHPRASLVAAGAMPIDQALGIRSYATLAELLNDSKVELVSLCSPRRADQARDAIAALNAGKHVYAEKPCAMSEAELDAILAAAKRAGKQFHEMAGTAFLQPYLAMRKIVQSGAIGEVVQVLAQKSYPWHDQRPQDESIDGGLIGQNAIHAVRFVEHVACQRVEQVQAIQTNFGNPVKNGGLHMAACLTMKLQNGGIASAIANYLNPKGLGSWGNETLRIFGTRGFVEATDAGQRTRLIVGDTDHGPIDTSAPEIDYFDAFLANLTSNGEMPINLETELHPTRIVIRATQSART